MKSHFYCTKCKKYMLLKINLTVAGVGITCPDCHCEYEVSLELTYDPQEHTEVDGVVEE